MSFRYEPVGDRVVVRAAEPETVRESGLIIPSQATEKPTIGTVVAIGDCKVVQAGDTVVYSRYGGIEIEVDGEKLLVLREADVLLREAEAEPIQAQAA